jgi:hypothetical protein
MRLSYDVGRRNGNSKIIQKSRLLGLHDREGVTKSPLEASDELEICAADEQRANNYQVHPYSAPVVLPRTARQTSFGGRARSKQKIIL